MRWTDWVKPVLLIYWIAIVGWVFPNPHSFEVETFFEKWHIWQAKKFFQKKFFQNCFKFFFRKIFEFIRYLHQTLQKTFLCIQLIQIPDNICVLNLARTSIVCGARQIAARARHGKQSTEFYFEWKLRVFSDNVWFKKSCGRSHQFLKK